MVSSFLLAACSARASDLRSVLVVMSLVGVAFRRSPANNSWHLHTLRAIRLRLCVAVPLYTASPTATRHQAPQSTNPPTRSCSSVGGDGLLHGLEHFAHGPFAEVT